MTQSTAADAWEAILRTHAALLPRLDAAVTAGAGLSLAWYDVLLELAREPEHRLRMSDLGERVVLSRTRVSRIVDELEAAGLVTRERNPDDGRSAFALLTAEGRRRQLAAARVYAAAIEAELGATLSAAQQRAVATALAPLTGRG